LSYSFKAIVNQNFLGSYPNVDLFSASAIRSGSSRFRVSGSISAVRLPSIPLIPKAKKGKTGHEICSPSTIINGEAIAP
jgi:hypothetical protein